MRKFVIFREIINDVVGTLLCVWGCILCANNPRWEFVVIVAIGATLVFGKKLLDHLPIPGMGGTTEDTPETGDTKV